MASKRACLKYSLGLELKGCYKEHICRKTEKHDSGCKQSEQVDGILLLVFSAWEIVNNLLVVNTDVGSQNSSDLSGLSEVAS